MDKRILLVFFAINILSLHVTSGAFLVGGNCHSPGCESTGPICVIDEMGVPKTFLNRCLAETQGCKKRTFYAEVKLGAC